MHVKSLIRVASLLMLGVALAAAPVLADTATDLPPKIGKLQVVRWNGIGVNTQLDGTVVCAAFGGPDNIAPPAIFAAQFSFLGGQYRPNTVDPANFVGAPNDTDRDQNWVYAYIVVNDEGDEPTAGTALINSVNISLPPCTAIIDQAIVTGGISGTYITEYGSTLIQGGLIPYNQIIIPAGSPFFNLIISGPVLQPGQTSETFFYYSPFGPSNQNASILGQETGQSRSHTIINALVTAQFFPHFSCQYTPVPQVEHDAMMGEEIAVTFTVNNENRSLDPIVNNPALPGNVLQIFAGGLCIPQHEKVKVTITSPQELLDCVDFRLVSGGAAVPGNMIQSTLDINKNANQVFNYFVFVKPTYFNACTAPLTLNTLLEAESPYDSDPPFEGHTKIDPISGMPVNLPQLDADEEVDGVSCTLDITIGRPPEIMIDKTVQFLDFTNPGNPVPSPVPPVEQVDSPPCGKVKFTITITADPANVENVTNFVLNDKLPAGLTFANAVQPPGVMFNENPPGSGCFEISGIPDLAPGASFAFCFRACVDPGTPPGILINNTDVIAEGALTGLPTNMDMDDARVNVVGLNVALNNLGVNDTVICTDQNAVFTFQVCNTGAWPLEVTIPAATLGAQLMLVSQNPAGGTVILLNPAQCQNIVVTAKALAGGPAGNFQNCVALNNLRAHPDMVATANQDCDLLRSANQCIDVIDPRLVATCVSVIPALANPGDVVTMTKRVTNTGNVALNPVAVSCLIDDELTVPMGAIPADLGPLAPGASVDIVFMATLSPGASVPGTFCVACDYVGHPSNLPPGDTSCDRMASSICCISTQRNEIPTLSEWGLISLVLLLGGVIVRRRVF
jgi:uncharacterized repeat protein (TIGR01451 family)